VNASGAACTVQEGALRIGFAYVNGLGAEAARAIAAERGANGAFLSLSDFVRFWATHDLTIGVLPR